MKLRLQDAQPTELRKTSLTWKRQKRNRISWSTTWTKRSNVSTSRRPSTKHSSFPRKKKQRQHVTLRRRLTSKLRRLRWAKRCFLRTGRKLSLVCSRETMHCSRSEIWLGKKMMKSWKLKARSAVSKTKQWKNNKSLRSLQQIWTVVRLSTPLFSRSSKNSKPRKNSFSRSTPCSKSPSKWPKKRRTTWTR